MKIKKIASRFGIVKTMLTIRKEFVCFQEGRHSFVMIVSIALEMSEAIALEQ